MEQETTDNTADSPDHSQDDPLLSLFIDNTGMSVAFSAHLIPPGGTSRGRISV